MLKECGQLVPGRLRLDLGSFALGAASRFLCRRRAPPRTGFRALFLGLVNHQLNHPPVQDLGDIALGIMEADRTIDVGQVDRINRVRGRLMNGASRFVDPVSLSRRSAPIVKRPR